MYNNVYWFYKYCESRYVYYCINEVILRYEINAGRYNTDSIYTCDLQWECAISQLHLAYHTMWLIIHAQFNYILTSTI